jgi:tetratricopeptide (TPR) repeat protein
VKDPGVRIKRPDSARRLVKVLLTIWPGLPQIWTGQEILGLLLAGLFAALVNASILCRLVWTEVLPDGGAECAAALAVLLWLASAGYTVWWLCRIDPRNHRGEIEELFRRAMDANLRGAWTESIRLFEAILALDETDADSWMHLGSAEARLGRTESARRSFHRCRDLDVAEKWRWELDESLESLNRSKSCAPVVRIET